MDETTGEGQPLTQRTEQSSVIATQSVPLRGTPCVKGQWVATVRYGIRPPSEVGESSFAFDTSGGTQHITQSLGTIASYAASP